MHNILEILSSITFVLIHRHSNQTRRGHVSVVHFLVNLLHLLVNPELIQLVWSGGGKSIFGGYPFLRALFLLCAEQRLKLVFLGQVNTY